MKNKEKKTRRPSQRQVEMPQQLSILRTKNFNEVALGYNMDMALIEAQRCLQCRNPTCIPGCPVEVDIKGFIGRLQEGDVDEAYKIIRNTNSLPAVCGRVCPQENQCQGVCVLAKTREPVAIGRLERFVADEFAARTACELVTGKIACPVIREDLRVACIGSGPGSLTAAGTLASMGIKVVVFEALHELGGVMVYGIPEFRLPKEIVRREVEALKDFQVEFRLNCVIGKTYTLEDLLTEEGFKAVFIGVGAGLPKFLGLPGENLIGVFSANEYLTRANLGRGYDFPNWDTPMFPARQAVVFGGGNVAVDAARTALRHGAEKVSILYRRTRNEMPARIEEIEHADEEGVEIVTLCAPVKFNGSSSGRLQSVVMQKMTLGDEDSSGRRRPVPLEGEFFEVPAELAVVAVGAGPNPLLLSTLPELALNKYGYIIADEETGQTSMEGVFAGGDIVTGSATVIEAMGAGRKAATAIAKYLGVI